MGADLACRGAGAFLEGLGRYWTERQLETLQHAHVGIAGVGGLGSNVALMLARCGIGELTLIDEDRVDYSNLNRQQFWPEHVGQPKVSAMARLLTSLNPSLKLHACPVRLEDANIPHYLSQKSLWVEAMDDASTKALFVETALRAGHFVVAASGIAGVGGPAMEKRRLGNLVLVGDFTKDTRDFPPLAPRVTQAAAMMADAVLQYLLPDE